MTDTNTECQQEKAPTQPPTSTTTPAEEKEPRLGGRLWRRKHAAREHEQGGESESDLQRRRGALSRQESVVMADSTERILGALRQLAQLLRSLADLVHSPSQLAAIRADPFAFGFCVLSTELEQTVLKLRQGVNTFLSTESAKDPSYRDSGDARDIQRATERILNVCTRYLEFIQSTVSRTETDHEAAPTLKQDTEVFVLGLHAATSHLQRALQTTSRRKPVQMVLTQMKGRGRSQVAISLDQYTEPAQLERIVFVQKSVRRWLARRKWQRLIILRGSEKLKRLHRNRAVKEIFESEAVYVNFLRLTLTFYRDPLREHPIRGLTPLVVGQLFSDFESVYNVAMNLTAERKTFLEDEDLSEATVQIGPFLRKCLPHLIGYANYLKNYEVIFQELQSRKSRYPEFAQFLTSQMEASGVNQPLESLLIMPVQRLPRYEMLIRNVLERTPAYHPDYEILKEVLSEIRHVNEDINYQKRLLENHRKIRRVEDSVRGFVAKTLPEDAVFVREYPDFDVKEEDVGLQVFTKSRLVIFSSHLLISYRGVLGSREKIWKLLDFDLYELRYIYRQNMIVLTHKETRLKFKFLHANDSELSKSCFCTLKNAYAALFNENESSNFLAAKAPTLEYIYGRSGEELLVATLTDPLWYQKMWDDRIKSEHPDSHRKISFFYPQPPPGFYCIGFRCETGSYHTRAQSPASVVVQVTDGSDHLLAPPLDYKLIWDDRGFGATYGDCGVWEAVPPEGYVALGSVVTDHAHTRPNTEELRFRCVHRSLVARVSSRAVWSVTHTFNIRALPCCTVYEWDIDKDRTGMQVSSAIRPIATDCFRTVPGVRPLTNMYVLYDHGCHRRHRRIAPGAEQQEDHHHHHHDSGGAAAIKTTAITTPATATVSITTSTLTAASPTASSTAASTPTTASPTTSSPTTATKANGDTDDTDSQQSGSAEEMSSARQVN
eukprot:CAMPEP_0177634224 /NCGR_PEP_ID=MMETSP0447-20121125/3254_1 /TAXON_ID=0 /ORGANISM="Stygamoeba regulata, Strain BSH-02190019" /LENGTH=946 /DNA_ID=CAMNT_0019135931 /DNA_START=9 /DNA_END=2845 /DNA_ORIENTATION=+